MEYYCLFSPPRRIISGNLGGALDIASLTNIHQFFVNFKFNGYFQLAFFVIHFSHGTTPELIKSFRK